ncbi:hypothetical protein [Trichothermofontia sp.]
MRTSPSICWGDRTVEVSHANILISYAFSKPPLGGSVFTVVATVLVMVTIAVLLGQATRSRGDC